MTDESLALAAAALHRLKTLEAKGVKAHKGDRGQDGKDGKDGARGQRGAQGPRGPQGERGPRGFTGKQGERGQDGREGAKGEIGPRGPQGIQGEKGDPGRSVTGLDVVGDDVVVTFDDGTSQVLEGFMPEAAQDGDGIANIEVKGGVLMVTLTSGRKINAGRIPTGGSGVGRTALLKLIKEVNPIRFVEIEVDGQEVFRMEAV